MTVHITHHAVDRYIERVAAVDWHTARERIAAAAPAIELAAAFHAHTVRLGNGARLVLKGERPRVGKDGAATARVCVVTVLARDMFNRADLPRARGSERSGAGA